MKSPKFQIYLESSRLFSNSTKAINLQSSKRIGELKQGKVIYSPYEAIYLLEKNKAEIIYRKKSISLRKLIKLLKKHLSQTSYAVFKDLTDKGYSVKTGLKFGTEFRVYKKNVKHALWLVYPTIQKQKINWQEFAAKNRIAHSTAKKLLIALVDSQEDITYYEVAWKKI